MEVVGLQREESAMLLTDVDESRLMRPGHTSRVVLLCEMMSQSRAVDEICINKECASCALRLRQEVFRANEGINLTPHVLILHHYSLERCLQLMPLIGQPTALRHHPLRQPLPPHLHQRSKVPPNTPSASLAPRTIIASARSTLRKPRRVRLFVRLRLS